jgi:hypothetical protein
LFKNTCKWQIVLYDASMLFAIVRVGWCTSGVKEALRGV